MYLFWEGLPVSVDKWKCSTTLKWKFGMILSIDTLAFLESCQGVVARAFLLGCIRVPGFPRLGQLILWYSRVLSPCWIETGWALCLVTNALTKSRWHAKSPLIPLLAILVDAFFILESLGNSLSLNSIGPPVDFVVSTVLYQDLMNAALSLFESFFVSL